MAEAKSFAVWAAIGGLLVFGTMVTILSKSAFEVYGTGFEDSTHAAYHTFQKPWALVLIMFVGMTWCLVFDFFGKRQASAQQNALGEPLLESSAGASSGSGLNRLLIIVPAAADLIATVLMYLGLVHITASVYQMLRGAELVFAAIFAVTFLKRKLNYMHLNGLLCAVLGVAMVGGSSLMSGSGAKQGETTQTVLYGMGMVVLSQMVQAVQLTFEDYFLADLNMSPMQVVGYEGLYGMLLMLGLVMPAIYYLPGSDVGGVQENSLDSIELIKSSNVILAIVIALMLAMLMYNFAGMCVTDHLGAVFRTILETLRTMFVWMVDCYLFYFTDTGLGEGLTKYSLLQLAGFVVLVIGTFVYDKGDVIAAKEIAEAAAATSIADAESQLNPEDSLLIPPRASRASAPSMAVAFSPSTAMKPSMALNAHSLSSSLAQVNYLGTTPPLGQS